MAKKRAAGASRKKRDEDFPLPSYLLGWFAPASYKKELLVGPVRCPCTCERIEFHYPGVTALHCGRPFPASVEIDGLWYYIIKAVCSSCRQERVLFDNHLHGNPDFFRIDPNNNNLDKPQLWPWRCLECGSVAHQGMMTLASDYKDRYFECGYDKYFGPERWRDAFGWFNLTIKCCGCGYETSEWSSYETR